jgi:hypothetical protein
VTHETEDSTGVPRSRVQSLCHGLVLYGFSYDGHHNDPMVTNPEGSWIGSLFPRVREADFSHGTVTKPRIIKESFGSGVCTHSRAPLCASRMFVPKFAAMLRSACLSKYASGLCERPLRFRGPLVACCLRVANSRPCLNSTDRFACSKVRLLTRAHETGLPPQAARDRGELPRGGEEARW